MSNKNVIAIQCDILEMPIKKEFFDIAYSWGVLHHTGNTRLAFKNAASLTKTDGILGVYLYENKPKYDYKNIFMRLLGIIRQILIILPLRYFAQLLSPIMVVRFFTPIFYFEKLINFGIVGCHSSGNSRSEKFIKNEYMRRVIDRFKSRYATEHTLEEVIEWFIDEKFNQIKIGEGVKICLTAIKNKKIENKINLKLYIKD